MDVLINCLLIVLARIGDVSLGTVRTVAVINGRRYLAVGLGFFEVLIWILIVSRVVTTATSNPVYAIAYAGGFAMGNFIGITLERWLAFGQQVVRIFTRVPGVAPALRDDHYGVTIFRGEGRDGPIDQLFVQVDRKRVQELVAAARRLDPTCYYVVDDVRSASTATATERSFWRNVVKMK